MKRIPLAVIELCDENGEITPLRVVHGGREYDVERVYGVGRHAPAVECVMPLRYDCMIAGKKKVIYRDGHPSNKWFSVR